MKNLIFIITVFSILTACRSQSVLSKKNKKQNKMKEVMCSKQGNKDMTVYGKGDSVEIFVAEQHLWLITLKDKQYVALIDTTNNNILDPAVKIIFKVADEAEELQRKDTPFMIEYSQMVRPSDIVDPNPKKGPCICLFNHYNKIKMTPP